MKKFQLIYFTLLTISITLHAADTAHQIMSAIEAKDRERVRQLINPDNIELELNVDGLRVTPLYYAISPLGDENIALDLIELAANINARIVYNTTPLHFAAYYNRQIIVQRLLEAGALRTIKDSCGYTPAASARANGHEHIAEFIDNWQGIPEIKEPDVE